VGSVGFILHCIFIIVLVILENPSIVFSWIGLVVTEILPSLALLIFTARFRPDTDSSNTKSSSNVSSGSLKEIDSDSSTKEQVQRETEMTTAKVNSQQSTDELVVKQKRYL
jgi:hypothetical protein